MSFLLLFIVLAVILSLVLVRETYHVFYHQRVYFILIILKHILILVHIFTPSYYALYNITYCSFEHGETISMILMAHTFMYTSRRQ